jgi:hypothetical protein
MGGAFAGGYDDNYDQFDNESAYMPAADGWDDGQQGDWDDQDDYDDGDLSTHGPAQSGRYGGAPGRSSFGTPNRRGGLLSRNTDDGDNVPPNAPPRRGGLLSRNTDDDDDTPPRRGGFSPGGSRFRR